MDKGIKDQKITLPATKPDNELEQEVTTDSQENMKTEEGVTKENLKTDENNKAENTKGKEPIDSAPTNVSFLFLLYFPIFIIILYTDKHVSCVVIRKY
jgi:hypothetical protein